MLDEESGIPYRSGNGKGYGSESGKGNALFSRKPNAESVFLEFT